MVSVGADEEEHQSGADDTPDATETDDSETIAARIRKRKGRGPSKGSNSKPGQPRIVPDDIETDDSDDSETVATQERKKNGRGPAKRSNSKPTQPRIVPDDIETDDSDDSEPVATQKRKRKGRGPAKGSNSKPTQPRIVPNDIETEIETDDSDHSEPVATQKRKRKGRGPAKGSNSKPTQPRIVPDDIETEIETDDSDHSEPVATQKRKRKGRGPAKGSISKPGQPRIVDEWGYNEQPIGAEATAFTSYLGKLVRSSVNINMTWKNVPRDLKDQMWAEVRHDYVIDESKKKTVIQKLCKLHRSFRNKLRDKYVKNTAPRREDEKEPYEVYKGQITKEDWLTFVENSQTPEFLELSKKNSERSSMNKYPHYMGRHGYAKCIPKWEETGLVRHFISDTGSTQSSEANSAEYQRHVYWFCARVALNNNNEIGFLNKEMKEAKQKLDAVKDDVAKGKLVLEGTNDILTAVVGKPEHPGRARGFGGHHGFSHFFGRKSRSASQGKSCISEEQLKILTSEFESRYELQVESLKEEMARQMQEEMARQMQETLARVEVYGPSKLPNASSSAVSRGNSMVCDPELNFDEPLSSHDERDMEKGKQKSFGTRTAPREESTLLKHPLVTKDVLEKLHGDVLELHEFLELFEPRFCEFSIPLAQELFNYTSDEFSTIINRADLKQFCDGDSLNISIIQGFMLYISSKMKEIGVKDVGFLCPEICSQARLNNDRATMREYLTRALKDSFNKNLILLPYNQSQHWILIVICPHARQGYLFDPASTPTPDILRDLKMAFRVASSLNGNGQPISFDTVKCRKQPGSTECGYYVMRYMYEIVNNYHSSRNIGIDWSANQASYSTMEFDEIRSIWARYFIDDLSNL